MNIFVSIFYMLLGAIMLYGGAISLACNMLPKEASLYLAEQHGKFLRKHVFHLSPIENKKESEK